MERWGLMVRGVGMDATDVPEAQARDCYAVTAVDAGPRHIRSGDVLMVCPTAAAAEGTVALICRDGYSQAVCTNAESCCRRRVVTAVRAV